MNIQFEPVSLQRQEEYIRYLKQTPQVSSDYSFVNLWGWQENYGLEWAFLPNFVLLKQTLPEERYWAPIGCWYDFDWQQIESCLQEALPFVRVPETLKNLMHTNIAGLKITDSRDHWDYLYSRQELAELRGNRFHKKKNLVRQFERAYDVEYISLDGGDVEKVLTFQTEWLMWRNTEGDDTLDAENRAIYRVLRDWDKLTGIMGGAFLFENRFIAYTIGEPLNDENLVIHFEKGCPNFKGIYQAINQAFLLHSGQNFAIVNREQDLGDPGLRKSKESYHPIEYLKKYEIRA